MLRKRRKKLANTERLKGGRKRSFAVWLRVKIVCVIMLKVRSRSDDVYHKAKISFT